MYLDELFPYSLLWDKKRCIDEAKKYKTKTDFYKGARSAYNAAKKLGIFDNCCQHMNSAQKSHGYWSLDRCKGESSKYKTRGSWYSSGCVGYSVAIKNKWIDTCCKHMKKSQSAKKTVLNVDTGEVFKSVTAAKIAYGSNVTSALRKRQKTAGGYRWAYCDENGNILKEKK